MKGRVHGEVTELHQASQKNELYSGFTKRYKKKDDEGEDYPDEVKRVQLRAGAPSVGDLRRHWCNSDLAPQTYARVA